MSEVLTVEEIESRYDSEWVLLEDPKTDEQQRVLSGKVLWHSKDRDEVYQMAIELRPRHSAFLYAGIDDQMYLLGFVRSLSVMDRSPSTTAWLLR